MPSSQRYKLTIAYRGTNYHGWQRQAVTQAYRGPVLSDGRGIPTIQGLVSRAIESVVRHPIKLVGSSRTDSGVHAKGQIAHFDTAAAQIPCEGLHRALNHALPDDIDFPHESRHRGPDGSGDNSGPITDEDIPF